METIKRSFSRRLRLPFSKFFAYRALSRFHSKKRSIDEIVDYGMKFPSTGLFRIDSIQIRSEFLALAKKVQSIQPKVILEIGTARGGTLFAWTQMASDLVVSCDLTSAGYKKELYKKLPPPGSKCRVVNLQGDSHSSDFKESVRQSLGGALVDFLFIDGDHTEKGVERDYLDYKEFVRPGGLIAFHDIVENQPYPTNQVYYFWTRLKKQNPECEEYVDNPKQCGFGIGVIRA